MQEGQGKGAKALNPIPLLIPSRRPVRLAIGALVNEIQSWPKSGLPWIPDSWVLQSSSRGFVWRYERWANFNQEVLAVALAGQ
jgi:hypothetical protein